jgi:hypothetical protein
VKKLAGFGRFNSVLWERISWNKLKQAETWPAEQDQSVYKSLHQFAQKKSKPVIVQRSSFLPTLAIS